MPVPDTSTTLLRDLKDAQHVRCRGFATSDQLKAALEVSGAYE